MIRYFIYHLLVTGYYDRLYSVWTDGEVNEYEITFVARCNRIGEEHG